MWVGYTQILNYSDCLSGFILTNAIFPFFLFFVPNFVLDFEDQGPLVLGITYLCHFSPVSNFESRIHKPFLKSLVTYLCSSGSLLGPPILFLLRWLTLHCLQENAGPIYGTYIWTFAFFKLVNYVNVFTVVHSWTGRHKWNTSRGTGNLSLHAPIPAGTLLATQEVQNSKCTSSKFIKSSLLLLLFIDHCQCWLFCRSSFEAHCQWTLHSVQITRLVTLHYLLNLLHRSTCLHPSVSKVHAGSFPVYVIQRTLTWTTGSLTCVRDHSYACVYTCSYRVWQQHWARQTCVPSLL